MDIRYKDLIKLSDGNEYVVSSMATYENEQYYYVINIHDNSIVKFLKLVYEEEQYFFLTASAKNSCDNSSETYRIHP